MTDIEPWLETEAPADVVESLRAARAETPRRAVMERCVALVGTVSAVGLSTSLASAASFGAGGKVGSLAILKWGLSGMAAGALCVAAVGVTQRVLAPVADPAVPTQGRALPEMTIDRQGVHSSAPRTLPAPPAPSTAEPTRTPKSPSAQATDERLAAELALLDRVRSAVDARDARLAGALLDEHERRYGENAPLGPEARYLRLEALELAGRRAEAQDVAREIVARDPKGPHAARAQGVLEKE